MKTTSQYTVKEIQQFQAFAIRHGMKFNNLTEYLAALAQYFKG